MSEPAEKPTFEKQVEELAAMARSRKAQLAVALREGIEVPAGELKAMSDLELRVANMEALLRLQKLTREAA